MKHNNTEVINVRWRIDPIRPQFNNELDEIVYDLTQIGGWLTCLGLNYLAFLIPVLCMLKEGPIVWNGKVYILENAPFVLDGQLLWAIGGPLYT